MPLVNIWRCAIGSTVSLSPRRLLEMPKNKEKSSWNVRITAKYFLSFARNTIPTEWRNLGAELPELSRSSLLTKSRVLRSSAALGFKFKSRKRASLLCQLYRHRFPQFSSSLIPYFLSFCKAPTIRIVSLIDWSFYANTSVSGIRMENNI